jgi:hypothetical protein
MTRLFISYSSDERAEAFAIQSWLEKNGWEDDVLSSSMSIPSMA